MISLKLKNLMIPLFFSLFHLFFLTVSTSYTSYKLIREAYAFDLETKVNCFYRTSTSVKGLDPAIWRRDQSGNLMMAGLNFNCKGCLCYTFDHRYPISNIKTSSIIDSIVDLMSSIDNCQALSFRANALKGSNDDEDVTSIIDRFGCDSKTMALFEDKNYLGARAVERYLLSSERIEQIHQNYLNYLNGPDFLDPNDFQQSRNEYFKFLNAKSAIVSEKIEHHLSLN